MHRSININALNKCDIILTTSTALQSKAIRIGTKTDISHAMICVAHGTAIDSTGEGVHSRNVQRLFYDQSCSIYLMRLKRELSEDEKLKIINYARATIGTPYSTKEALKSIKNPRSSGSDLQFCSRLAARAFAEIGIHISNNPDYCTPADIKNSSHFFEVPDAFITITDKEKTEIESSGSTLDDMRAVTNNLLDLAKTAAPNTKILAVSDIVSTLLENKELDSNFSDSFTKSGYLDHWKKDIEKHPYRYDIKVLQYLLSQNPASLEYLVDYCQRTLEEEKEGTFDHWKSLRLQYRQLLNKHGLETLRLCTQLYDNLVSHHEIRIKTARDFLENYQKSNKVAGTDNPHYPE